MAISLQYFVEKKIPVLGIEPAANVAKVAVDKGSSDPCEVFWHATGNRTRS